MKKKIKIPMDVILSTEKEIASRFMDVDAKVLRRITHECLSFFDQGHRVAAATFGKTSRVKVVSSYQDLLKDEA